MKKALVTGIAGFAGSHLAEHLLANDFSITGFFHKTHPVSNIDHIKSKISLIECDITDEDRVKKEIKSLNPDYVFHLAAFSSPAQSFDSPREALENNIVGQLNILEALVKIGSKARTLIIGSADEYGNIDEKYLPAYESATFAPISPYAVSKIAQDLLGLQFFLNFRLNIVRVRPFNHIGPRQSTTFAIPSFAAQIAALEKQGGGTIKVGNLENSRDFTDVRDTVRAYLLALEQAKTGEVYNIGTGHAVKVSDILDLMLKLSKIKIKIEVDKSRIPPVDIKTIYCDFSKFKNQTGWQPAISLEKTLFDTIEYERSKLN